MGPGRDPRGLALLDRALGQLAPEPFQIKAAISALHVEVPDLVRLNRAVVLAELAGPEAALREIEALREPLDRYQPPHAARADILSRLGDAGAAAACDRAVALSGTKPARRFLARPRKKPGTRPG